MNKTKKALLSAGTITTIVFAAFAVLFSLFFMLMGNVINEEFIFESYYNDEAYEYYEDINGDYYFIYTDEGVEYMVGEEDIQLAAEVFQNMLNALGSILLVASAAKIALAIITLVKSCKNKFSKGPVITLIVLNGLTGGYVELGLLIAALCIKNKQQTIGSQPIEPTEEQLTIDV